MVYSVPAEYLQYRDDTGQVHNVPARDLTDDDWAALPAEGRAAVKDSPLYTVATDAEHKRISRAGPVAVKAPVEGA